MAPIRRAVAPHRVQVLEKRLHEPKQFLSLRSQAERRAHEELRAQRLLQPQHLAADGWLLDAIGNVAQRTADAAVARHKIEKLKVVRIEHGREVQGYTGRPGTYREFGAHFLALTDPMRPIGFID